VNFPETIIGPNALAGFTPRTAHRTTDEDCGSQCGTDCDGSDPCCNPAIRCYGDDNQNQKECNDDFCE
jgi:hypothetical protein